MKKSSINRSRSRLSASSLAPSSSSTAKLTSNQFLMDDTGINDGSEDDLSVISTMPSTSFDNFRPDQHFSIARLSALTLIFAGVQFVWTIEMGYGTPYLLSFGISKSVLTLAWLAGPLSGLIIQPVVGAWSDICENRYGRRRPFIVVAALAIVCSLFLISYARDMAWLVGAESAGVENDDGNYTEASLLATMIAIGGFYLLDFAINAVQAASRSLIVDVLATADQNRGHSYASFMIALGNIAGYLAGSLDLVDYFNWRLGNTQMKSLSSIACLLVVSCTIVTCLSVHEDRYSRLISGFNGVTIEKWWLPLALILQPHRLPREVRPVFSTQFLSWIAWFPFSFFTTEYVKELWMRGWPASDPVEAVRMGSFALFLFSIVSIIANLVLPWMARRCYAKLKYVWSASQLLFCLLLMLASWADEFIEGALIVALVGICMAVSLWIPFALVGLYLSRREDLRRSVTSTTRSSRVSYRRLSNSKAKDEDHNMVPSANYANDNNENSLQTGVLLGLHNAYIVMPQFLSSMVCSGIFYIFPDDGINWVWRFAAISSLLAALMASRVR